MKNNSISRDQMTQSQKQKNLIAQRIQVVHF